MWCWRWPVQSEKGVPVEGPHRSLYSLNPPAVFSTCLKLDVFCSLMHCQKSVNAPQRKKHQHSLVFLRDTTHMLTCLDLGRIWCNLCTFLHQKKVCICNTMPNVAECSLALAVYTGWQRKPKHKVTAGRETVTYILKPDIYDAINLLLSQGSEVFVICEAEVVNADKHALLLKRPTSQEPQSTFTCTWIKM